MLLPLTKEEKSKFSSTSGFATKSWGPHGWYFLFSCILGTYPVRVNTNKPEHRQIMSSFKSLLTGLQYTMPCIFCRKSFTIFLKELPIKPFLVGRLQLCYWLYLIRDKVNKKLMTQERACYEQERATLWKQVKEGDLNIQEYKQQVRTLRKDTLITLPSPPFVEVLYKYEQMRAVCSPKAQTCALTK